MMFVYLLITFITVTLVTSFLYHHCLGDCHLCHRDAGDSHFYHREPGDNLLISCLSD